MPSTRHMVLIWNSCRCSLMKRYFTRAPWQSTARLFLECPLLLGASQLRSKLENFALGFDQLGGLLLRLVRRHRLHPLVKTVAPNAETSRNLGDRIPPIDHLADGFLREFGSKPLGTHEDLLLCSNHRRGVLTKPGEVHCSD